MRSSSDGSVHTCNMKSPRAASAPRAQRCSQPAQPDRRAEESLRIDGVAIDARLVVQVRAGRAPGGADLADHLADTDGLSLRDIDRRQMAVARRKPIAVIDLDHLAVAAAPAG